MVRKPYSASLKWENQVHLREWAWCDALFMAPPALAMATRATGDTKYVDLMDSAFTGKPRVPVRYPIRPVPPGQPVFQPACRRPKGLLEPRQRMGAGRPGTHPGRPGPSAPEPQKYIELFKSTSAKVAGLQNQDGFWRSNMLIPEAHPAPESSGTALFVYALAWGVNAGILDAATHQPVVAKGWRALVSGIDAAGKVGFVQRIGYAPGETDAASTEVYGTGALLLAGTEVYKLVTRTTGPWAQVAARNPLKAPRFDATIEVPLGGLKAAGPAKWTNLYVTDAQSTRRIPHQLVDADGNGVPESLLFQGHFLAGETRKFNVGNTTLPLPAFRDRTFGRLVPERLDDFAWENDRIGFRVFGPALMAKDGPQSGVDVWVKSTPNLVLNKFYKSEDYHRDHGEGLDYYKVGANRGAGALAIAEGSNFHTAQNFVVGRLSPGAPCGWLLN